MFSSGRANGAGVGSSPGRGSMSVQTIVLTLDDPDSHIISKQGFQQTKFAAWGQLIQHRGDGVEKKFESWAAATTKHHLINLISVPVSISVNLI